MSTTKQLRFHLVSLDRRT